MSVLRLLAARVAAALRHLRGARDADDDLRAEMEAHLEMHVEDNLRRGMSPEAARREALLAAGGLTLAVERTRERRGLPWAEDLVSDIRYALRGLRGRPGFSAAIVLTLALGIGANAAMFTIVNAVVLRPLPYPEPNRILSLSVRARGVDGLMVDDRNYLAWAQEARSLVVAATGPTREALATSAGPVFLRGREVTPEYFGIFGVMPTLGRLFTTADGRSGAAPIVLVSEQLWRNHLGASPSALGRMIVLGDETMTVVGVMPASFATSAHEHFWRPLSVSVGAGGSTYYYEVVGRLRGGASLAQARLELAGISRRVDAQRPDVQRGATPVLMTLHERMFGDRRTPLLVLSGAVGVLLLIACANIANLVLARAAGRRREFAVRLALGARRARLVRLVLCESLLLALAGAALGLALSSVTVRYVSRLSPAAVGNVTDLRIDATVLLFTLVVTVATGVLFGLAPAFTAARGEVQLALSAGSPRASGGLRQQLARRTLVVAQLATALVLLTAAGLVARTFWRVASIDPGFEAEGLAAVMVRLPSDRYDATRAQTFFGELLARARRLPDVESASYAIVPPLGGFYMTLTYKDERGSDSPPVDVLAVDDEYFRTIRARIIRGRAFSAADVGGAPEVAILNATMARQLGPRGEVGRRLWFVERDPTVVGVVDDVLQGELEATARPTVYIARAQDEPGRFAHLLVRTAGASRAVEPALVRLVQSMDPTLPPARVKQMERELAEAVAPRRFTFILLAAFASLAVTLAAIGVYGVLAHLVADRTREIGIRVALGADARRVTGLVLRQGLLLVALGAAIGVGASAFAVKLVRGMVYQMSVHDPWTFAGGTALLVAASLLASYLPARRASRVDPIIALRAE